MGGFLVGEFVNQILPMKYPGQNIIKQKKIPKQQSV